jgi:epoxide hydrolase-like predicted phosphatase
VVIKAVVFDIGGVLEVTPPTGWEEAWSERLGFPWSEIVTRLEATWEAGAVGDIELADVEQQTMAALCLTEAEVREFMDDLWDEYLGSLNQELADYFASLRPRYKAGILSNSFVGARERECAAYGFDRLCDTIVYSHEEGMLKPNPRFYRIVTERLGVQPHETVFLDDAPACVEGALDVGMKAVTYVNNQQAIADIEAHLDGGSDQHREYTA